MDAHGVEVFDGADNHAIVLTVADHFQLKFLPAQERLFDQNFACTAGIEAAGDNRLKLIQIVGDAATRTTEGKARTDDQRPLADGRGNGERFRHGVRGTRERKLQAEVAHDVFENLAVFRAFDGFGVGADQLDIIALKDTAFMQFHGQIQRGLSAECGQHSIRTFAADDLVENLNGQRLNVGAVSKFRIRHDGCRVAVDQHHFKTLFLEDLAGLHAGIVEFTALSDGNRSSADQHDLL